MERPEEGSIRPCSPRRTSCPQPTFPHRTNSELPVSTALPGTQHFATRAAWRWSRTYTTGTWTWLLSTRQRFIASCCGEFGDLELVCKLMDANPAEVVQVILHRGAPAARRCLAGVLIKRCEGRAVLGLPRQRCHGCADAPAEGVRGCAEGVRTWVSPSFSLLFPQACCGCGSHSGQVSFNGSPEETGQDIIRNIPDRRRHAAQRRGDREPEASICLRGCARYDPEIHNFHGQAQLIPCALHVD